jgi:cadmium resistance transport/sequestration family protein
MASAIVRRTRAARWEGILVDSIWVLVGLAVAVYVSTNLDDVFLLLGFFADPRFRTRDVIIGQYLGIGALYVVSALASFVSLVISMQYVGLLGLIPIGIGVKLLLDWGGDKDDESEQDGSIGAASGRILSVAAITVANGGDNIGVYVPFFATRSGMELAIVGVVFAVLTAAWCVLARQLVQHPVLGAPIRRYGHKLAPFVLIAVGILVLHDAGSIEIVRRLIDA